MSFLLEPPSLIEGIGPQRSQALAAGGIKTIAEMLKAGRAGVSAAIDSASDDPVDAWLGAAHLLRVKDVTPDFAEAFADANIRSVAELADAGLQTLEHAIEAARSAGKMSATPSLYKLAELQRNAWRARDRGMLVGRVVDSDGAPITGTNVDIGRYDMTVDSQGRYAFHAVPEGEVTARVQLPGRHHIHHFLPQTIIRDQVAGPLLHTIGDAPANPLAPLTLDEFDGDLFVHTARYRNRQVTLPLSSFRDGTHFLVREVQDEVKLLSLYKKRRGDITTIERARVTGAAVPTGTAVGQVLLLAAGALQPTTLTSADVAELKRQRWITANPTITRNIVA